MDVSLPPGWLLLALTFGAGIGVALAALLTQQVARRHRAERDAERAHDDLLPLALALRHAVEAVIVTGVERRITWVNEAFERITGYSTAEAMGRRPGELLQFEGTDPATIVAMRRALDAGESFVGEVLNLGKREVPYWLHLQIIPLRDRSGRHVGFVAIQSDITERRRADAALRASAELLRGAFEAVDEGFALWGPDDRLVFCNGPYRAMHPLTPELVQPGTRLEDLLRAGVERGQYAAATGHEEEWVAQRLAAHAHGRRTLVQRLSDGRILRVLDRKMPDGHSACFRVDITELVKATEAAESAAQSQAEFIATISHELRTPLQVINGNADLGRVFAREQPPYGAMFDDVLAAGQRMLRLVDGLLDISKFDGGGDHLVLKEQALAPLAAAVQHELAPLAAARGLEITHSVPATLRADVDAFRLQQVLRNLIANALRFAPAGSRVQLAGADLDGGGVELTVCDQGPGIPPDELEAIFEPFVQSSRTRDGSGGTGLGLAICRRLMAAHGGRITAELPAAGGACFRLWLPPLAQPASAESAGAPRRRLATLRPRSPNPSSEETSCPEPY